MRRLALSAAAALAIAGCGGGGSSSAPERSATTGATTHGRGQHAFTLDRGRGHAPRRTAVPILMYHVIGDPPAGAPYPGLFVPWGRFVRQMLALRRAGYHAVTLGDVFAAWHGGPLLPRRPIVVSFDDGYESQAWRAGATLRALRWPGVLNLEVHNVGLAGGLRPAQVRTLLRHGWELDAHTLTHPDLTTVDAARLQREVAGSRRWLRRRFGVPVRFFAYPSGRYDARTEAAVRAAGFRGATTTDPGLARPGDDPYALARVRVEPQLTPSALLALVGATSGRPS
ncbi:MAG TPA: polysaccharide deacetylase family protein [Solirubrobacteraceae bacterium]|jgi:peptidoglycan/xylan/chitin deacetylase (PgdA/CDA1 family)|nr:polysaccharide deacetylase family protein [Solirubrobacteraceae bacterium]